MSKFITLIDKVLHSKIRENLFLVIIGIVLAIVVTVYNGIQSKETAKSLQEEIVKDLNERKQGEGKLFYSKESKKKDDEHDERLEKLEVSIDKVQKSLDRIEKKLELKDDE